MTEFTILSAFIVGLLSGAHCAGMCGGIVGGFSLHAPGGGAAWRLHLAYSGGRIGSYALAGAAAGALGSGASLAQGLLPAQLILYVAANLVLIALGLYLAGFSRAVLWLEAPGNWLWRHVQPIASRLFPVRTVPKALALGALWGFIPCGLVYSVLFGALASANPASGAAVLAAFGLGTLPNLLAIGLFAQQLQAWRRQPVVRVVTGMMIVGFGVLGLTRLEHVGHAHHHAVALSQAAR